MRQIMQQLLALQALELDTKPLTLKHEGEILKLREKVPAAILTHFNRLIARGKKGVAIARNGVCSECHLRVTPGTLASLAYTTETHLCDNCGRYLYLPENEPLGPADSPTPTKVRGKSPARRIQKKTTVHTGLAPSRFRTLL
jgi:predicted  nucleic acid-binding Zn-ribbon protein